MLPEIGPDALPAGWASNDELWVVLVVEADPSTFGLMRFDVRRRVLVEQRTIDTGGSGFVITPHVTPDGKNIVFHHERLMGHLYLVRGLPGAG